VEAVATAERWPDEGPPCELADELRWCELADDRCAAPDTAVAATAEAVVPEALPWDEEEEDDTWAATGAGEGLAAAERAAGCGAGEGAGEAAGEEEAPAGAPAGGSRMGRALL